jgi:RNA polymerase sigma factor (sigma-70 family)
MTLFGHDPALLSAFREGRRDALAQTYRSYVRLVERYLHRMARASGAVELAQPNAIADLLQDVFIRAFSPGARMAYDGLRPYGAYLTVVARNCFIDTLRTHEREVPSDPHELLRDLEISTEPVDIPADPRLSVVVEVYLKALPPKLREICELRFALGQSQQGVSDTLGMSRRSLRTAEARLRKGLRRALARSGISLQELRPSADEPATNVAARVVEGRTAR